MFEVINYRKGNVVVGKYKTRKAASRAVDRLDNAYGAYSYRVREVQEPKKMTDQEIEFHRAC